MQLDPMETALIEGLRTLPPNTAQELSDLILRLAALAPDTRVHWSDSWTEDDLQDFTVQSIRQLEKNEE